MLLPAWFGCGAAFAEVGDDEFRDLYERLPFFRTMIDNLEMTLAKSSLSIARGYLSLVGETGCSRRSGRACAHRRRRAGGDGRRPPARAAARAAPLDRPAQPLRRPDEAVQVALLRRYRAGDTAAQLPLLRSIAGIAAALRNTG